MLDQFKLTLTYFWIFNMGQPAERKGGGKNPLNILSFWDARTPEPSTYWEEWIIKFHWVMIAKNDIDPDDLFC